MATDLALIFDLDGVIIDSMPLHTEAWRIYLDRLGIAATPGEIEPRMHGKRNDDIVADFISAQLAPAEVFAHGAAKERLYRDLMRPQLQRYLVPGVGEFLSRWQSLPLAVASNAEPENVDLVLDAAGLRHRFRVIVDGHQVARPKPFPDVYLRAAELLGIPASRCIVFEDSPTGVEAALSAGMRVVGVQTHSADLVGVDLGVSDFQDAKLDPWLDAHRHGD